VQGIFSENFIYLFITVCMSALQDAFLIRYSPKLLDICLRAASDTNDYSSFLAYPDIMLIWHWLSARTE